MADFCKLLMGGCPPSPPQGKAQICAKRVNKNEFCWGKKKKKKKNFFCKDPDYILDSKKSPEFSKVKYLKNFFIYIYFQWFKLLWLTLLLK